MVLKNAEQLFLQRQLPDPIVIVHAGLGAPDNASFAARVATNDIVRSQIDERILRAAEQGLPFKGGDL